VNITQTLADEGIRFINKSIVLSRASLNERILAFLGTISERHKGALFDIGMNQEEFAAYLGVNRSSLSSALNRLRRDGTIDFNGNTYRILK
jgi:CRP-like cAMP-binding protein